MANTETYRNNYCASQRQDGRIGLIDKRDIFGSLKTYPTVEGAITKLSAEERSIRQGADAINLLSSLTLALAAIKAGVEVVGQSPKKAFVSAVAGVVIAVELKALGKIAYLAADDASLRIDAIEDIDS